MADPGVQRVDGDHIDSLVKRLESLGALSAKVRSTAICKCSRGPRRTEEGPLCVAETTLGTMEPRLRCKSIVWTVDTKSVISMPQDPESGTTLSTRALPCYWSSKMEHERPFGLRSPATGAQSKND